MYTSKCRSDAIKPSTVPMENPVKCVERIAFCMVEEIHGGRSFIGPTFDLFSVSLQNVPRIPVCSFHLNRFPVWASDVSIRPRIILEAFRDQPNFWRLASLTIQIDLVFGTAIASGGIRL